MLNKDVIVACDFASAEDVLTFLDHFKSVSRKPFVKIGMELYYAEGAPMVREIRRRGHSIFLDLKLHDIPTTVERAMRVLGGLDVDMVNVHAAGGSQMMQAARRGLDEGANAALISASAAAAAIASASTLAETEVKANVMTKADAEAIGGTMQAMHTRHRPKLIAVTQLTSTSEQMLHDELLIGPSMPDTIISYARNAASSGLDGVVCSPLESEVVHAACPEGFLTVTPGVRFESADVQDQKRVMTPAAAREAGSDYIVVGRPITRAEDPLKAYERCIGEFLNESLK